jgi:AcrR family transcriptional regulator
VSRPVNVRRPEELCEAIAQYLIEHGLSGLSLRPLAKAIGSSPRGLLYHFGSKEKMVMAAIAEIRRRQRMSLDSIERPTLAETYEAVWKQLSSPHSETQFRFFFEVYGIALRRPRLYHEFLHETVEDWLQLIAEPLVKAGAKPQDARAFASVVLASLRGFMLDLCNTRDRQRIDRAVALWATSLDAMLPGRKVEEV